MIVTDFDRWPCMLALPPAERHAPAPTELIQHLQRVNGFPAQPAQPDAAFRADLRQALAELPDCVQRRLDENFLGVFFVTGAGSSAATDIVVGADGTFHGIVIILDVATIGEHGANQWLTWRENMPFAPGALRVSVRIAEQAHDQRHNALQMLLLHEIGHLISAGRKLLPDWWLTPDDIGDAADYSFLPLSWTADAAGMIAPHPRNAWPQRDQLRYYATPLLGQQDILPAYRALLNTDFFTLYGAQSPAEDFAESFALYVHTVLLQKPYFVRIYQDQRLLLQYASEWSEPRFAAKRALLEKLLPDLATCARQPYSPLLGMATLMRHAFRHADLAPVAAALLARAQAHPDDAHAWLDCATVWQLNGVRTIAMELQAEALRLQTHYQLPYGGEQPALRLLVLMGPGDLMANTPIEFLLEGSDVGLELLYLRDDQDWPAQLPAHDLLMVGIAESDHNQPLLRQVASRLKDWPRPVLNRPELIARLSRDGAWRVLATTPGVLMPPTSRATRADLTVLALRPETLSALLPGAQFPLIVRPLGSHAGQSLEKIDTPAALLAYLERVAGAGFYLSAFVDYSNADGLFRKYRLALIDGQPFICHCAISAHWMVHYLNAGMDDDAAKRDEEARLMQDFTAGFANRHGAALTAIQQRLGLPYLGIDCAEAADGRLLVFEVDNAMVVHAMDDPARYPYKQPAMRLVFSAFRRLLASYHS